MYQFTEVRCTGPDTSNTSLSDSILLYDAVLLTQQSTVKTWKKNYDNHHINKPKEHYNFQSMCDCMYIEIVYVQDLVIMMLR